MNMLERVESVIINYAREEFSPDASDWGRQMELCEAHGIELRGFKPKLDIPRYLQIQKEGRLVLITARDVAGVMQGYSIHIWHRDLHFPVFVAQDDAWYVVPELRKHGIGRCLREHALEELKKAGVRYAYGRLKTAHPHDGSMIDLGYQEWESVWIKEL